MNELLLKINNHIIETSRAGHSNCRYEVDSKYDQYEIKQAVWNLEADGWNVKRNKREITIYWSN